MSGTNFRAALARVLCEGENMEQMTLFRSPHMKIRRKNPVLFARENISYYSADKVDLTDLLTVIIGNHPEVIGKLVGMDLREIAQMSKKELMHIGATEVIAIKLVAIFGIAKKLAAIRPGESVTVRSPQDVANVLMDELKDLKQEHFVCLYLNTKNQIEGKSTIFVGTLNSSVVHPREVFKEAVKRSSSAIIVAHNHPSGDPTPSREDIEVTKRLKKSGELMGIDLLDHIIIGNGRYVSLKERGDM